MCDEDTAAESEIYLQNLSRRQFNGLAAGIAVAGMTGAAVLPVTAAAETVMGSDVEIVTPDGTADAYFVYPKQGKHPAVLIWPDIMGLRSAFRGMATRLAASGYAVLVVNPFYRSARAPIAPEGASFRIRKLGRRFYPMPGAFLPVPISLMQLRSWHFLIYKKQSIPKEKRLPWVIVWVGRW